jgi:hypothetical protein
MDEQFYEADDAELEDEDEDEDAEDEDGIEDEEHEVDGEEGGIEEGALLEFPLHSCQSIIFPHIHIIYLQPTTSSFTLHIGRDDARTATKYKSLGTFASSSCYPLSHPISPRSHSCRAHHHESHSCH